MQDRRESEGWTTSDLDALPEDGNPSGGRRELLDGVLMVPPSPSDAHQFLAAMLVAALHRACPPAFGVTQAVDVRLSERRSFCPDVLVITAAAAERDARWFRPDEVVVAIEIVSPTSVAMDVITKPALYAGAGIPFYWRVETAPKLVVHTYALDEEAKVYRDTGTFADIVETERPWFIRIALADLSRRSRR
ncbi:Uma2 family endonuclease [Luedemannella flava]